jgi:hypothetical protein
VGEFDPATGGGVWGGHPGYNRKSVSIISEQGLRWNVAPQFLNRVIDVEPTKGGRPNVIPMRKK